MTTESFAEKLAKEAVDGLLKQATKQAQQNIKEGEVTIDPETQKKIIENEIKMVADPQFALTQEAALTAADRMRRSRERLTETRPEKPAETDKATLNKEIGEMAKTMISYGIPPNVVAQVMIGMTTPNVPIAFPGGGNQGLTLTDVLTLVDRMNANKGNSEMESIIKEMRDEIKALKNPPKVERIDPIQAQASQVEGLTNLVESLIKLGVVQRPSTEATMQGKPLEVVKEENRSRERIMELQNKKDYDDKIAEAAVSLADTIPRAIGEGIAAHEEDRQDTKAAAKTATQQYYDCQGCHTLTPIERGATQVTCSKCGVTYQK